MFRAPCAHRQEVRIVLYSIWFHHICRWLWFRNFIISSGKLACLVRTSTFCRTFAVTKVAYFLILRCSASFQNSTVTVVTVAAASQFRPSCYCLCRKLKGYDVGFPSFPHGCNFHSEFRENRSAVLKITLATHTRARTHTHKHTVTLCSITQTVLWWSDEQRSTSRD